MIFSLVSPEFVVFTAWLEFCDAWRLSKKCETIQGWTLTHSYFTIMGGFTDGGDAITDPSDFGDYPGIVKPVGHGTDRQVAVTKQEILDKSKGDFFTKSIVILQLLWFTCQYVGRWASHLPRSQLEVMTLAYTALTIIVCALWWHKPLNLHFPIQVTKESHQPPPTQVDQMHPAPLAAKIVEIDPHWIFLVTGLIFGGIHCLAWSFSFPTSGETQLWRNGAIMITVAPPISTIYTFTSRRQHGLGILGALSYRMFIYGSYYLVARVILLVVTFTSLRSPPPALYQTPQWSSIIPHFG
ncbi:uncharacterized protein EI90DRAFT_3058220 [Cantharellus anzutake]|uniref:uncharacterized protein n=1 Tax=Cantharellus anzutake TaxID=1750568 RepID=UPI001903F273|nr:uncharacterized protein EI90DRAFT_3058220 [Cantharellus anzutake]KAF8331019.1 hypothetical protein EI90DRAFT_3058220 [Cantharellus anzutake]